MLSEVDLKVVNHFHQEYLKSETMFSFTYFTSPLLRNARKTQNNENKDVHTHTLAMVVDFVMRGSHSESWFLGIYGECTRGCLRTLLRFILIELSLWSSAATRRDDISSFLAR